jgi:hypothetical protein
MKSGKSTLKAEVTNISEHGFWILLAKKENIEQLFATRCFPEGRKNRFMNFMLLSALESLHLT